MSELTEQEVMEQRGYLVIGSVFPHAVGSVLPEVSKFPTGPAIVPGPLFVIAPTDSEDWEEQSKVGGWPHWGANVYRHFCRVVAE